MIAITVVLAAVFIPSALQPGAAGAIYKQFALTIAMSMAVLGVPRARVHAGAVRDDPQAVSEHREERRLPLVQPRVRLGAQHLQRPHRRRDPSRAALDGRVRADRRDCSAAFLFTRLPGSFLPEEDQGYALAIVAAAAGRDACSAPMRRHGAGARRSLRQA